ncbi:hypothetical protein BDZ90DRAFT_176226 [Jaminaea rosea]|uniref:Uncharacterized protein n=1 Tax=Jaminaea rosea TaxID=1569628 RepID=A0A316UPW8_9BASI|nr:hypothetical protein BDZ90DRAFT_176226 [Jaminaea rosea]PWN27352.1 hypothetical protein BDZ90DRAFT_176226 [Jaminaea rosea]
MWMGDEGDAIAITDKRRRGRRIGTTRVLRSRSSLMDPGTRRRADETADMGDRATAAALRVFRRAGVWLPLGGEMVGMDDAAAARTSVCKDASVLRCVGRRTRTKTRTRIKNDEALHWMVRSRLVCLLSLRLRPLRLGDPEHDEYPFSLSPPSCLATHDRAASARDGRKRREE